MSFFRQIWAVTLLNLQTLPRRLTAALVMMVGIAGAVAATLSLLALGSGLRSMAMGGVDPNLAIIFSSGASGETTSDLQPAAIDLITQAPGVRRDAAGRPLAEGEAVILMDVTRKGTGVTDNVNLRGVGPAGLEMRRQFRLTGGRMFRPGLNELIVGHKAAALYEGLGVGSHIVLRGVDWSVVGEFAEGGGLGESEMLTDAKTELAAFARPNFQSAFAELNTPRDFSRFSDALSTNPQISLLTLPYASYVASQVRGLTAVLNFVAYLVGTVMALGAIFAAVNSLYAAVDTRRREIATLRAIGFGGLPVLVSVLGEAVALALPSAILGAMLAWALFNGRQAEVSGVAYDMAVTPALVVFGLVAAIVVALVGAMPPGIRAARLPVAEALRAT